MDDRIELYSAGDHLRESTSPASRRLPSSSPRKEPYRTAFRQDYGRLIHSCAFRRLQGKTQLFPGIESDFFRNRLTHSIEVAQIAKSIANRINSLREKELRGSIDTDLVETAALAHDLGHPPFGHNGELALNKCMKGYGGFEGNAQTLRILSRLEKKFKVPDALPVFDSRNRDPRHGLNLTYRTLAAILKYDQIIPSNYGRAEIKKGYYECDAGLVEKIRSSVANRRIRKGAFKTIECTIMDLADDIAYSTYDLEDALKGDFVSALDLLTPEPALMDRVCRTLTKRLERTVTTAEVWAALLELAWPFFGKDIVKRFEEARKLDGTSNTEEAVLYPIFEAHRLAGELAHNGYERVAYTSWLVGRFISAANLIQRKNVPTKLWKVDVDKETRFCIEVLKVFTFEAVISSPRLKITEYRGADIVSTIFSTLVKDGGDHLLPDDFQALYRSAKNKGTKYRIVCDFVAGMTDRYAVEFYRRILGADAPTIWKPY
jgi:dGTPase